MEAYVAHLAQSDLRLGHLRPDGPKALCYVPNDEGILERCSRSRPKQVEQLEEVKERHFSLMSSLHLVSCVKLTHFLQ